VGWCGKLDAGADRDLQALFPLLLRQMAEEKREKVQLYIEK
jgi:hypothetical protein